MKKAVFVHSADLEKYRYPADHPFNTTRAANTRKILKSTGLLTGAGRSEVAPEPAERVILKKFHTARYLHALKTAAQGRWDSEAMDMGLGTSDCPVFKGLYDYSVLASGATLTGAKLILSGDADIAFNPSGGYHHAWSERASGFCYINDVALACIVLAEAGKRVLYLDVDVHHGDGVAYAFYDRSDIMTISLHQNPQTLFPGTGFASEIGNDQGKGYCVNVPLPVGTYDEAYIKAFKALALPLIGKFNPDVFVFELGADALADDPLGNLNLTNNTYADIIDSLLKFNLPILATGGGGYHVDNTARAWALAWSIFVDGSDKDIDIDAGGLRDRQLTVSSQQRNMVAPAIEATIETVKSSLFPVHGL